MSVRFLNPKNVMHGARSIEKVSEVRIDAKAGDLRRLTGDGAAWPKRIAALEPAVELAVVTEDVTQALAISPGATAALSFQVADAETGATKTITAACATFVGPSGDIGGPKQGPASLTLPFACWSTTGANPISIA